MDSDIVHFGTTVLPSTHSLVKHTDAIIEYRIIKVKPRLGNTLTAVFNLESVSTIVVVVLQMAFFCEHCAISMTAARR